MGSSMQFSCCREDKSLVISNYTDAVCSTLPDAQFRISADYNGQCLVIGDDEGMIDGKKEQMNENAMNTYVYLMKWQCNDYEENCDGIELISDDLMPSVCTQQCIENEQKQEKESNHGREIEESGEEIDGTTNGIGVIVAVVLVFAFIVIFSVVYGRKKSMQRAMERNV